MNIVTKSTHLEKENSLDLRRDYRVLRLNPKTLSSLPIIYKWYCKYKLS